MFHVPCPIGLVVVVAATCVLDCRSGRMFFLLTAYLVFILLQVHAAAVAAADDDDDDDDFNHVGSKSSL